MRLFFAVQLDDDIRDTIARALEDFPLKDPPWRWIRPENLHITLKFLGEVDEILLDDLIDAAADVALRIAPFSIAYGPFGGFPSLSRPRVLFYAISDGAADLAKLAKVVEDGVAALGFPVEKRAFKAHVTLARLKRPLDSRTRDRLKEVHSLPSGTVQEVERFSLMRSHLRRDGAVYEELKRFQLEGHKK